MTMALYRKYRPKTFSDIHGQEMLVAALKSAAAADRIGHAYLFCGIRGTGKTTTARLLAKTATCHTRQSNAKFREQGDPCNTCDACISIDAGQALDVIELDAASNRKIDEMREIKEAAQFSPSYLARKVFIIDEAHALTKDAANALLKLLEEPPAHALFILATTEPEKLLPTIISRTQRFDLRRLSVEDIMRKLAMIAEQENISIEADALRLIAYAAEGSLRDAESMLDQIASFGSSAIGAKDVEEIFGRVGMSTINELCDSIIASDPTILLPLLHRINDAGHNPEELTTDILKHLRRILTSKLSPEMLHTYSAHLTPDELEHLKTQSDNADTQHLARTIAALIAAQQTLKFTTNPMLAIESALIREMANSHEKQTTQKR